MINGDVSNAVVGSEVVYSCMSNFELEGFPNRVCQEGGVWSGEGATCECKENEYNYYLYNNVLERR